LILVILALCVAATMTAIALERRRDIAVMKALGAGDRTVLELFLGEAALLGLAGGAVGFALGGLAAHHLALRLFGVTLRLVWWTFPVVCLVSVLVALVAASLPVRLVRGVQPAAVLKGE
jgi:putative ABC transport system permease protein